MRHLPSLLLALVACGGDSDVVDAGHDAGTVDASNDGGRELDAGADGGGGEARACSGGFDCDDALWCNGLETCVDGFCVAGAPLCAAGESCEERFGQCADCAMTTDADRDGSVAAACGGDDCDESDGAVHPGVVETCNGRDDDCDGAVDDAPASGECASGERCLGGRCQAPSGRVVSLSAGQTYSCAVLSSGEVYCWGAGRSLVAEHIVGVSNAVQVSAGVRCAVARRADGTLVHWGGRGSCGFSFPGIDDWEAPSVMEGFADVVDVSVGQEHVCAVVRSGRVLCAGYDLDEQLGDGPGGAVDGFAELPVDALGVERAMVVSAGGTHTCALRDDRVVVCWGSSPCLPAEFDEDHFPLPRPVSGSCFEPPLVADEIATGYSGTCVRQAGRASCWPNEYDEEMLWYPTPIPDASDVSVVRLGYDVACVLTTGGQVLCEGDGEYGGLGNGRIGIYSRRPVHVLGVNDATSISVGFLHACAGRASGAIACWGRNTSGELGDGTTTDRGAPVEVVGLL